MRIIFSLVKAFLLDWKVFSSHSHTVNIEITIPKGSNNNDASEQRVHRSVMSGNRQFNGMMNSSQELYATRFEDTERVFSRFSRNPDQFFGCNLFIWNRSAGDFSFRYFLSDFRNLPLLSVIWRSGQAVTISISGFVLGLIHERWRGVIPCQFFRTLTSRMGGFQSGSLSV